MLSKVTLLYEIIIVTEAVASDCCRGCNIL